MLLAHTFAFLIGFILDMVFGDPYKMPHPIRFTGSFISFLDKKLRLEHMVSDGFDNNAYAEMDEDRLNSRNFKRGILMLIVATAVPTLCYIVIMLITYRVHIYLGFAVEAFLTYQLFAAKSLKKESMKVYNALKNGTIESARYAVSMIVGRDTKSLDKTGITKAAVETVAENTSDGVIAPMIFCAIGGPVVGVFYKSVNTLDSMIGYKNDKYMYFGRASAKLDDVVNFVPARVSAWLMIIAAYIDEGLGKLSGYKGYNDTGSVVTAGSMRFRFSGRNAAYIYGRDRNNHASPNSAHTESVCAGALGIKLAGDAIYFGKLVKKPTIGDALRDIEIEDIRRANRLMYATAWLCLVIVLAVLFITFMVTIQHPTLGMLCIPR